MIVIELLIIVIVLCLFFLFVKPLTLMKNIKDQVQNPQKHISTYFFPVIGLYREYLWPRTNDCLNFAKQYVREKPFIKMVVTNFISKPFLMIYDLDMLKEFLIKKHDCYEKNTFLVFSDLLVGDDLNQVQLKQRRDMFSPIFHFEELKQKIPMIQSIAEELLKTVSQKTLQGNPIYLTNIVKKAAGDLMIRSFFGKELLQQKLNGKELSYELIDMFNECVETTKYNPWAVFRNLIIGMKTENTPQFLFTRKEKKLVKRIRDFKELLLQEMLQRLEKEKNKKLSEESDEEEERNLFAVYVQTFLKKQQEKQSKGEKSANIQDEISFEFIFNQFMVIYVAAMDTLATSTTMTLYLLSKNTEEQEILRKEIQHIQLKNKNTEEVFQQLKEATYLQSCITEGLRIYAPTGNTIPRQASKDHKLGSVTIKKGTIVAGQLIAQMSNSRFFPEPEKFIPTRWIEKTQPFKDFAFSYLPFSAGPRNCQGQHLALMEMKIYLINVLQNYQLKQRKDVTLKMIAKPVSGPENDNLIEFVPLLKSQK